MRTVVETLREPDLTLPRNEYRYHFSQIVGCYADSLSIDLAIP